MKNFKYSDMSKLSNELDSEYAYFENSSKIVSIESASFKRLIKHLTSGVPVMIVSAFTDDDDVVENNKNTKLLIKDIIRNRLSFIPVNGYWKEDINDDIKPEKSFFVIGKIRGTSIIDVDYDEFFDLAVELCNKYNQTAVLIGKANKDKIEYNYIDKDGNFINNFTKIKEITDEDIIDLIKENGGVGYTQYKKKKNGKFVLESVVSAIIDEEELKNSKATMFAKRQLYKDFKNYGLYFLEKE